MYPHKKHLLQLIALLKAFNIKSIVLSPGSRNAPLIQAFSQDPYFDCCLQIDERNAGFFALGLIQQTQQPVAVCCTSGTALLNYAPAVAEAYYQHLPLLVLSADLPTAWIGQMDGQTIPQPYCFANITSCSVQLFEIQQPEDEWHCNRLINEALIALTAKDNRPVHINIPIAEPLFDYSVKALPKVRKIHYETLLTDELVSCFQQAKRKMLIVGQLLPDDSLTPLLIYCATKLQCVVITESIANQSHSSFIHNVDVVLASLTEKEYADFQPDLVISLGGHIISKRLKHWLRDNAPQNHWQLSAQGELIDLFQCTSHLLALTTKDFLTKLSQLPEITTSEHYLTQWQQRALQIPKPNIASHLSDISVIAEFVKQLPNNSLLYMANSSPIRYLQLFELPKGTQVFCNRGTNGIDGSLASFMGFASQCDEAVYLITGDLSFFHNLGALWQANSLVNLRILLINNSGGGIFHLLPKLNESASLDTFVAASHATKAKAWVEAAQIPYQQVSDWQQLQPALVDFMKGPLGQSKIVEVITDISITSQDFQYYYQTIQQLGLLP